MTNEILIERSKIKIIILLVISFVFVVISIWIFPLSEADISSGARIKNITILRLLSILGFLLFGMAAVIAIKNLFNKTPGLIVNDEGMTDHSSVVAVGFIPWSDIEDICQYKEHHQTFMAIVVKNPDNYLNRGNLYQVFLRKQSMKSYATPITISALTLKIRNKVLYDLLKQCLSKYKQKIANSKSTYIG